MKEEYIWKQKRGVSKMYLYNNVELPALPTLDYPCALIEYTADGSKATLYVSDKPLGFKDKGSPVGDILCADEEAYYNVKWGYLRLSDENVTDFVFEYTADEAHWLSMSRERVLWANYDVMDWDTGTVLVAASEPVPVSEPVSAKTLDRTSMLLGWLAGRQMAICRNNSSNKWYNLLDLKGSYTSYQLDAKYTSGDITKYTEIPVGEHPLQFTCVEETTADCEYNSAINWSTYPLNAQAGAVVKFEVIFPTVRHTGVDYGRESIWFILKPPAFNLNFFELHFDPTGVVSPSIESESIFENYDLNYTYNDDGILIGFTLSGKLAAEMYGIMLYYNVYDITSAKPFTCTTEVTYKSYNDIRYQIKEATQ